MIQSCSMAKILLDTDSLFDTTEASQMLGMGYATLYRWISRGKIVPIRVMGRTLIPQSEIDRILQDKASQDGK